MTARTSSADDILAELGISNYLQGVSDCEIIDQAAQETLKSMERSVGDYRLHLENVHKFMEALWTKYDCQDIVEVLSILTSIEPALLDLERERESGKGYRDHYVHLFHVFVFGLRMLSAIIKVLGDEEASKTLKVRDESFHGKIRAHNSAGDEILFRDYPWKERLFYLWTLMSTLHDIAIPITHLGRIREALNRFSEKLHLEIWGPLLVPSFSADLDAYFELLSRIFEGKFGPGAEAWRYNKANPNPYVKGYFEGLFRDKDHGVLGGFLMYKKIEEIFLEGRSKYKLDMVSFRHYRELVLEEDIARAALSISLHNVGYGVSSERPNMLPLNFYDYPLCFILILADSLQEYLRWEGTSIRGGTKLYAFPHLELAVQDNGLKVDCSFSISKDRAEQEYFRREVNNMLSSLKQHPSGSEIGHAADDLCRILEDDITKKVALNECFTLCLHFYEDDKLLRSYTFHTPAHLAAGRS